jgi:hydrophobic/amphiphilic exporter-1 (mainly G- bacteria), HAE1 family
MESIYKSPFRVYLLLGAAAIAGLISGFQLPISLFPNSSQPVISVSVPYGDMSLEEFNTSYGPLIEGPLIGFSVDKFHVEELITDYTESKVSFKVKFQWGCNGDKAQREIKALIAALAAGWPDEIRRGIEVNQWRDNGGFLAISFFSPKRTLDEIYEIIKASAQPELGKIKESEATFIYNPQQKSIEVTLDIEKMSLYQILTTDVQKALSNANVGASGGNLTLQDGQTLNLVFPKTIKSPEQLKNVVVSSRFGRSVYLKDIASIRLTVDRKNLRSFKTNGSESIILFSTPRPGGNIKKMADEIMAVIENKKNDWPSDIEYRVLVNPSEFINSSIKGVIKEVGLAAMLAVLILFLFIGSFKNVATAAVEIPISIVMAFILMKFFDMNLNLISLGGLALSAGMNVDASVVVMENIFRHFNLVKDKKLSFDERVKIVVAAVNEVKVPIISSTVASLVVFIPLIATKGLTNAILGDLAKAVVFSHSLSAVVALILVPTVRLQMMGFESSSNHKSPIEGFLNSLESKYKKYLSVYLSSSMIRFSAYILIVLTIALLGTITLPKLPKEIIGRPETDWIILGFNSPAFSESRQMSSYAEKIESDILKDFENEMLYTFTQINGANNGNIMIRLKSKRLMPDVWKKLEEKYTNTPDVSFYTVPWNPSELTLPSPPHFKAEIRGGTAEQRTNVAFDIKNLLLENKAFPRARETPSNTIGSKILSIEPIKNTLFELNKKERGITQQDLSDYLRVATEGKTAAYLNANKEIYAIQLMVDKSRVQNITDIKGLPVALEKKVLPLSALANIEQKQKPPGVYRIDQNDIHIVEASENESNKKNTLSAQNKASQLFKDWKSKNEQDLDGKQISVQSIDPNIELNAAIDQLKIALFISIILVFLTMVFQFGDLIHSLLVLVSIPLGILGVISSLWLFNSSLSLNSILGVILLNGITVANSVILVDFMKKLYESGLSPIEAAIQSTQARLRPILMTSITTILGMMPIALGFGEGGKILQPLGVAVCGGLWVSMLLTLFIVPGLQYGYLTRLEAKKLKAKTG